MVLASASALLHAVMVLLPRKRNAMMATLSRVMDATTASWSLRTGVAKANPASVSFVNALWPTLKPP
jgi:Flp pilus assembly protein protease CpaA